MTSRSIAAMIATAAAMAASHAHTASPVRIAWTTKKIAARVPTTSAPIDRARRAP